MKQSYVVKVRVSKVVDIGFMAEPGDVQMVANSVIRHHFLFDEGDKIWLDYWTKEIIGITDVTGKGVMT